MSILIPMPKKCVTSEGATHTIPYYIFSEREEWQIHISSFCDMFFKGHARRLTMGERGGIELCFDAFIAKNTYRLTTDGSIKIYASTSEGICYGLASVLQLAQPTDDGDRKSVV